MRDGSGGSFRAAACTLATATFFIGAAVVGLGAAQRDLGREVLAPNDGWASLGTGTTGGASAAPEQTYHVETRRELIAALNNGVYPGTEQPVERAEDHLRRRHDRRQRRRRRPAADLRGLRAERLHASRRTSRPTTRRSGDGAAVGPARGRPPGLGVGAAGAHPHPRRVEHHDRRRRPPGRDQGRVARHPRHGPHQHHHPQPALRGHLRLLPGLGSPGRQRRQLELGLRQHLDPGRRSRLGRPQRLRGRGDRGRQPARPTSAVCYQVHDGLVDITNAASYLTVSWNRFLNHDKTMLIGSSDSATADRGQLKVTLHHNVFDGVGQRAPRVRFGQVHVFNNYYRVKKVPSYGYSWGVGMESAIYAEQNFFRTDGDVEPADFIAALRRHGDRDAGHAARRGVGEPRGGRARRVERDERSRPHRRGRLDARSCSWTSIRPSRCRHSWRARRAPSTGRRVRSRAIGATSRRTGSFEPIEQALPDEGLRLADQLVEEGELRGVGRSRPGPSRGAPARAGTSPSWM